MAIVYQHRRVDTNEIFYVGIGKNRERASKLTNFLQQNRVLQYFSEQKVARKISKLASQAN